MPNELISALDGLRGALRKAGDATPILKTHLRAKRDREHQELLGRLGAADLNPDEIRKNAFHIQILLTEAFPQQYRDTAAGELRKVNLDDAVLRTHSDDVKSLLITQGPLEEKPRVAAGEHAAADGSAKEAGASLGKKDDGPFIKRWQGVDDHEASEVLAAVRKRAEAWQTGTASVLALITAALVLTNAKDTARLFRDPDVRLVLALFLAVSATAGIISLALSIRAANGPTWLDTKVKESVSTTQSTSTRDLRRARAAAKDLRLAQRLLGLGAATFILLVALLWVVPHSQDWGKELNLDPEVPAATASTDPGKSGG